MRLPICQHVSSECQSKISTMHGGFAEISLAPFSHAWPVRELMASLLGSWVVVDFDCRHDHVPDVKHLSSACHDTDCFAVCARGQVLPLRRCAVMTIWGVGRVCMTPQRAAQASEPCIHAICHGDLQLEKHKWIVICNCMHEDLDTLHCCWCQHAQGRLACVNY